MGNKKDLNNHLLDWLKGRKLIFFCASDRMNGYFKRGLDSKLVSYICDNDANKWGKFHQGIEIASPERLKIEKSEDVVIVVWGPHWEIEDDLVKWGFSDSWLPCIVMEMLPNLNKEYDEEAIQIHREEIVSVIDLLADEKSKKVYNTVVDNRLKCEYIFRDICQYPQYFVDDIICIDENEVYVDAGLCNGDVIDQFIKFTNNKYLKIYGFEPDISAYEKIKEQFEYEKRVEILPYALHSENTMFKFSVLPHGSSKIEETGEVQVKAVKLDDMQINEQVTFIKMDIEGAEKEGLLGAFETIKKDKPKLAISLYHKVEDLWELPLLIHSINPNYKLYIRHHSEFPTETVLYAI